MGEISVTQNHDWINSLVELWEEIQSEPLYCDECGELTGEVAFCDNCGAPLFCEDDDIE